MTAEGLRRVNYQQAVEQFLDQKTHYGMFWMSHNVNDVELGMIAARIEDKLGRNYKVWVALYDQGQDPDLSPLYFPLIVIKADERKEA
jgi:hypothetical protein